MQQEELLEICQTDPTLSSGEKEFLVGFTKDDEKARFFTSIASQIKRAINHTDIELHEITVYNETDETHYDTTIEDLRKGNDVRIVACRGSVPIESLKIQSKPRSQRSYSTVISPQTEVNFDD